MMEISRDEPGRADVRRLLDEHLADMFGTSPAESVHALDSRALSAPGVSFWTAREDGVLLGCGALKVLGAGGGEVKSMRTTPAARRRGVAALLLAEILAEAERLGLDQLYVETGSQDFFAPARRLYARHGFTACPPFADYALDPHSVFMSRVLSAPAPASAP